jgi:hypothetical protein
MTMWEDPAWLTALGEVEARVDAGEGEWARRDVAGPAWLLDDPDLGAHTDLRIARQVLHRLDLERLSTVDLDDLHDLANHVRVAVEDEWARRDDPPAPDVMGAYLDAGWTLDADGRWTEEQ